MRTMYKDKISSLVPAIGKNSSELVYYLTSDPHLSKKKMFYLLQRKPFKNNEKRFSFHLKSSFRFQDI